MDQNTADVLLAQSITGRKEGLGERDGRGERKQAKGGRERRGARQKEKTSRGRLKQAGAGNVINCIR